MSAPSERNLARLVPATAEAQAEFTKKFQPDIQNTPALPAVNWGAVNQQPPTVVNSTSQGLPKADAVVFAWTEAEWAAMEHVFCASGTSMPYSSRTRSSWPGWQKYTANLPTINDFTSWGEYRLVKVGSRSVLLFKSETHLDHPGQAYLTQLIDQLISSVKPSLMISTGTAGGARPTDHVGTVNVVNAASLFEREQPQSSWPNYPSSWSPNWSLVSNPGFKQLLFPVPTTPSDLASICSQFNKFYHLNYSLAQLNPGNVNTANPQPAINNLTTAGTPLLTTPTFVVGTNSGTFKSFACIEMDDAIIAGACVAKGIAYGSVRNISDPVQNSTLNEKVQGHWGQAIYDVYGFYTSYNGAVAAWAVLN
jgi:nucleoside phosphorylase